MTFLIYINFVTCTFFNRAYCKWMKQRSMKTFAHVSTEKWAEEDVRGADVQNPNVKMNISIQTANVRILEGAGQAEEFSILTKLHLVNYQKIFLK